MAIRMDQLVRSIGSALDIVEGELWGVTTNHGKRIAALCAVMGRRFELSEHYISAITSCALFHDSALTESAGMPRHCEIGQRNVELLPLGDNLDGLVLYHHEHADGSGIFGKRAGEYPLGAEMIAIADMLDVENKLQRPQNLETLRDKVEHDPRFTKRAAKALLSVLSYALLEQLRDENIFKTAEGLIPAWSIDVDDGALMRLSDLAARIIDYKSEFTRRHTSQIANRAWLMSEYYEYSHAEKTKLYLAASLHDIGKLATPSAILEKPDVLTDGEFIVIKDHVLHTQEMLREVGGLEDISAWAGNHHEKLDGSGYPNRLRGNELDFNSRLLACIDIYQGVSEARPYHGPRSHEETMLIMYQMVGKGFIDPAIVRDMDTAMKLYSMQEVPKPDGAQYTSKTQ
ncbi:HD family phosphohydrolase [Synergistales bacterium]|nr:HD family phosphohydrolase [Synergistales bacterium]